MQKIIPPHLVSTYKMLKCAFPNGIDEQIYLPLLAVLYNEMSDRTLARVIADFTGKDYFVVLNDVYRVGGIETLPREMVNSIKQQLVSCGYENWLAQ
jgi:hypothetical protein